LGVVPHAERALRKTRPGLIEHELAVAVALDVGRRERERFFAAMQADVTRHPPRLGRHAPRLLEGIEPGEAQKGRRVRLEEAPMALLAERPHRRPRAYLQRHRNFRKRYAMSSS